MNRTTLPLLFGSSTPRNTVTTLCIAFLMVTCGGVTALAQSASKVAPSAQPQPFHVCKMTYALCVYAPCEGVQITGDQVTTTCQCPVLPADSWSVGASDCEADKPNGVHVKSRYSPVSTYARCTKPRPWAMRLDSDCKINPNANPNAPVTASCSCAVMQGVGDFLYDAAKPEQCDSGIMSSATVDDLDTITDYLQTQTQLKVFDFTVVNKQKK